MGLKFIKCVMLYDVCVYFFYFGLWIFLDDLYRILVLKMYKLIVILGVVFVVFLCFEFGKLNVIIFCSCLCEFKGDNIE